MKGLPYQGWGGFGPQVLQLWEGSLGGHKPTLPCPEPAWPPCHWGAKPAGAPSGGGCSPAECPSEPQGWRCPHPPEWSCRKTAKGPSDQAGWLWGVETHLCTPTDTDPRSAVPEQSVPD